MWAPPTSKTTNLQQSARKEMRRIKVKSYRHKQQLSSPQTPPTSITYPSIPPPLPPVLFALLSSSFLLSITDLNRPSCGGCYCFVEVFVFVRSNRLVRTPRESCDLASSLCLLPCMRLFSAPAFACEYLGAN